jgi:imidazolonepropionase
MFDTLWKNINVATMAAGDGYGIINNAVIGIKDGRIAWIGKKKDLPGAPDTLCDYVLDGEGKWVTPGLIDCHTHLAYAGSRANEFEQRLHGVSYQDIAAAGGGINASVRSVRETPEDILFDQTLFRLLTLFRQGVTSFEIKSGYGLDTDSERKLLRVATRLRDDYGFRVQRTFLGAHALPPEFSGRADDYIDMICAEMLPTLAAEGLIDAVDAFCERIAFSAGQVQRVFDVARNLGLPVKLHAEQLSNLHGARLAAQYQALSADHLEYLDEDGVRAMKDAGTVAVLLPGAFYFLREKQLPPIDLLRQHGVPMAVATDHNPGTSPCLSLLLMLNMACTLFRLTPEEALAGATRHAAAALGWQDDIGTLEKDKAADFVLWDIAHPRDLCYMFGNNPAVGVVKAGEWHGFAG